jgi:hypothetical protein
MIEAQDLLYVRGGAVYPGYAIHNEGGNHEAGPNPQAVCGSKVERRGVTRRCDARVVRQSDAQQRQQQGQPCQSRSKGWPRRVSEVRAQTLQEVAVGMTSPYNRSPGTGRPKVETIRKPFVAPQLKEEASLVDVTLISGKGCTRGGLRHGFKKGKQGNLRRGFSHGGRQH